MGKYLLTTLAILLLFRAAPAQAFCFAEAGAEYGVAPQLLWAISRQESGNDQSAIRHNTNGTYDYGHMQINSSWYSTLGSARWAALADPCQSTRTGAWILNQCIQQYGYNWKAVGCYHSRTPDKRDKYANSVAKIIQRNTAVSITKKPTQMTVPLSNRTELAELVWPKGGASVTPQ